MVDRTKFARYYAICWKPIFGNLLLLEHAGFYLLQDLLPLALVVYPVLRYHRVSYGQQASTHQL